MGNIIGGGRRMAKVMMIDGKTFKLKTPVKAAEVLKDYPDHVVIESKALKEYGIKAKPLGPREELKPRNLYFLVILPKLPVENAPRRVRSAINMTAKDRLESLMLSRRSASDLTLMKSRDFIREPGEGGETPSGIVRIKMRLPKDELAKLVEKSKDATEAAEKIMELCMSRNRFENVAPESNNGFGVSFLHQRDEGSHHGLGIIKEKESQ